MKKPMKKDDRPAPGATHDATAELDRTAAVIPMRKRRGGWPARTYKPGERVPMSFRVTPEFKEKLDRAALKSGRSLIQEIEILLLRGMEEERQDDVIINLGIAIGARMVGALNILNSGNPVDDGKRFKPTLLALCELILGILKHQKGITWGLGDSVIAAKGISQEIGDRFPQLVKPFAQLEEELAALDDKTSEPTQPRTRKPRARKS
jgi:hypothetical protein